LAIRANYYDGLVIGWSSAVHRRLIGLISAGGHFTVTPRTHQRMRSSANKRPGFPVFPAILSFRHSFCLFRYSVSQSFTVSPRMGAIDPSVCARL
jgi:2-keto-3-deoxy-6-phosphogluconate aldolase